ncbi:hypothetical protein KIN20_010373 [Parelaphostrongylus tenuis]|uniref:Uncharacterized protein n=1 Tax=Parelaphostrongylus tenuis TaxID=148309 RepID=A0AAD5QIS4_PARTN|nr:hypothetical protein KIN20_010373 [Parelaphostrongylus tenuis]
MPVTVRFLDSAEHYHQEECVNRRITQVCCGQQYVSLLTTTSAYGESTVKMWIDGRPVESKTS